jgi:ribosomal protein L19
MLIKKLEKLRIKDYHKWKKKYYIKKKLLLTGYYLIVFYMNREKEKGLLRYQFNKGICMSTQYKGYNSSFQIRSIANTIAIEQQFLNFSRFNILMLLRKNPIKKLHRNNLKFLRKKKNKLSKFKVEVQFKKNIYK